MKIVFISNYMNYHQKPLCDALAQRSEFVFLASGTMPQDRKDLFWQMEEPGYVSRDPKTLLDADVVIAGSAPEAWVRQCIRRGQLVFRYSERPLRKGIEPLKFLPRLIRWHFRNPPGKPIWLLSAGGYAARDYARFGLFRGRALRWGYFPELGAPEEKQPHSLLWVGRLLELKHPEEAVYVADRLQAQGYDFQLRIVGTGPEEQRLRQLIEQHHLQQRVQLLGAMPPHQVREWMAKSEIFLFTSDRREGWGAVLNEAMSCGCAVIASKAAGATPYLIRHGENGLSYPAGDMERLYRCVKRLMDEESLRLQMGINAGETVRAIWNEEVAACRFVQLAGEILAGEEPTYWADGPCSRER